MRKLRDREQIILALCIGVVFLYVTLHYVIGPLKVKSQEVGGRILAQRRALKKDARIMQKAKNIAGKRSSGRDIFEQKGTDEETVSRVISEIEQIATRVDLHISELKPAVMKRQGDFNTFGVNLVFDAPFGKIVEFLDVMQGGPYYFTIDTLEIVKQMGVSSADLRVNLSLSRIFIPD